MGCLEEMVVVLSSVRLLQTCNYLAVTSKANSSSHLTSCSYLSYVREEL